MLPSTCDKSNELNVNSANEWSAIKILEKLKLCNCGILKIGSLERNRSLAKEKEVNDTATSIPSGFVLLVILIAISGILTIIMWFTEFYMFQILQFVTITEGSSSYNMWINPPVKPFVSIYPFNYTNIDDIIKYGNTPVVQELGPFVYREKVERINVEFNKNGTVTYQEKRSSEFVPELSKGNPEHLTISVPNLPLISALSMSPITTFYMPLMSMFLEGFKVKPFLNLKINDYFWGYEDNIYTLAQGLALTLHKDAHLSKFGIISSRRGTSSDQITIHSGVGNLDELGIITRYNGQKALNVWKTEECNRLDGSDGSQFPPTTLNRKSKLFVYNKDLCRRFPLIYKEDIEVVPGVTAFRFQAPRNVFDTPITNPDNDCYYTSKKCPPSGVFNSSPCNSAHAPVMTSFPHFYLGDPELRKDVLGLSPDPELHETFIDVHSKLGVSLGGRSRFQVNIMLKKAAGIPQFKHLKEGIILPVAWIEVKVDKLPDDIKRTIQQTSICINLGEILLKWTSLLTLTLSMVLLVRKIILKDCFMSNENFILPMNK